MLSWAPQSGRLSSLLAGVWGSPAAVPPALLVTWVWGESTSVIIFLKNLFFNSLFKCPVALIQVFISVLSFFSSSVLI